MTVSWTLRIQGLAQTTPEPLTGGPTTVKGPQVAESDIIDAPDPEAGLAVKWRDPGKSREWS